MSVPTHKQAFAFLRPLRGRASVFTVPSRSRNSSVADFLLGCLAESRTSTMIFDTSSFYGANITTLTQSLPKDFLQQSTLFTPPEDLPLEDSMTEALTIKTGAILIDDLNALHYLLSSGTHRSGTHRLFAFIRLLSYEARTNDLYVFGTVYKADGDSAADRATKRSALRGGRSTSLNQRPLRPYHVSVRRDKGLAEQPVQHAALLRPEHVDSYVDGNGNQDEADRQEEVNHPRLRRLPSAEV